MNVLNLKRLVVVIPTRNEERSIESVLEQIPKNLTADTKVVVIDKSSDGTPLLAKKKGALVVTQSNGGLGTAFQLAVDMGLKLNADIMVHIDGDLQYDPGEMHLLVQPILEGKTDMVLGRRILQYRMPLIKRFGNRFFSLLVSKLSGAHISDAQTGYRALNKKALEAFLLVRGDHTYTQETIIIAAKRGLRIREVPVLFKKRNHGRSFINLFRYPFFVLIILMRVYIRELKPSHVA